MDPDLLERLRAAVAEACREGPILAVYAFGSRVLGRPRADSDLDLGYYLRRGVVPPRLPIAQEMALADALSRRLGVEVDLRPLADAPMELRGRVLEEGIRLYSAQDAERVALECHVLSRYHDYKDVYRRMHEERLVRDRAMRG